MNKMLLIGGGALIIALGAVFFFTQSPAEPQPEQEVLESPEEEQVAPQPPSPAIHIIVYSGSGYVPAELTILQGDTVTFRNETSREIWPATDIHPSHTLYPGSNRQNCGTPEGKEMFDACRGLKQGEEYSFTFHEAGTWRFHDHLRPSVTGAIIVEE